jgi:hypothetical protein
VSSTTGLQKVVDFRKNRLKVAIEIEIADVDSCGGRRRAGVLCRSIGIPPRPCRILMARPRMHTPALSFLVDEHPCLCHLTVVSKTQYRPPCSVGQEKTTAAVPV